MTDVKQSNWPIPGFTEVYDDFKVFEKRNWFIDANAAPDFLVEAMVYNIRTRNVTFNIDLAPSHMEEIDFKKAAVHLRGRLGKELHTYLVFTSDKIE